MPRKKEKEKPVDNRGWADLTSDEGVCLVCCEVLNEPIQLPCRCRTRMKCTMCRLCFKRMTEGDSTECRSACPVCGQRMLNWMRGVSKDKSDYRSAVNEKLWEQIQRQFQPYNPNGKTAEYSQSTKRLIAETGDIRTEYIEENEKARERFMAEKIEEESINLKLLEQNPQLKEELEQQAEALRQLEEQKKRKDQEEADARLAAQLMKEQEEEKASLKFIRKQSWEETTNRFKKFSQEMRDAELAKKLATPPRTVKPGPSKKRAGSTPKRKPPQKTQKNSRYGPVCDIRSFFSSSSSSTSSNSSTTDSKSPTLFPSSDSERTPSPDELFKIL